MLTTSFRLRRAELLILAALTMHVGHAQDLLVTQPVIWSNKPDIATFEKMETDRLARAQSAIDRIVAVKGPRTIENTLAPYDEAIRQLDAASNFSGLMQQVHPDTAFRDHATAITTRVSGAATGLSLNQSVYRALSSLDLSHADAATHYYVGRQMLEFRQAGVDKNDADRKRLKELNEKLTEEQSMFDRNISDGQLVVEVSDASQLEGLPQDYLAHHKPGPGGKNISLPTIRIFFPLSTTSRAMSYAVAFTWPW